MLSEVETAALEALCERLGWDHHSEERERLLTWAIGVKLDQQLLEDVVAGVRDITAFDEGGPIWNPPLREVVEV